MSELLIVRHAQAAFHSDDYDQLSDKGRHQADLLGQWLMAGQHAFSAVACGSMLRHRDTLAAVRRAFVARGRELPETISMPGLDEFDHKEVIAAFVTRTPEHPDVLAAEGGRSTDLRAVYRFLRAALQAWAQRELDDTVREPWDAFKARVRAASSELLGIAQQQGPVLVVTSGGVISQLAAIALDLPDARAVEMNLTIRNSALSEFHATDDGLRLASWNTLPHLADPEHRALWTYY